MPRFSARTDFAVPEGPLAHALDEARARGAIDLAESNPTRAGFLAPDLVAELGHARGAAYEPSPRGAFVAREAIARGRSFGPERVVLTASTSESYAWIFQLLCEPGDDVLVPAPSYPLFEVLARVSAVEVRPYALDEHAGFGLDLGAIERAIGPRTRALVAVHPNNPTGTLLSAGEGRELRGLLGARGLALVVDEVFADYVLPEGAGRAGSFADDLDGGPLAFVLSGLSKALLLPQVKLGWMIVGGDGHEEALARLEWIADTFLSASTPAQLALPRLLDARPRVQAPLLARLRENLGALDRAAALASDVGLRRLPVHAGWTAVLEVPRTRGEDAWCRALAEAGVVVQPGYFFDFAREGYLVVSLLPPAEVFARGAVALAEAVRSG